MGWLAVTLHLLCRLGCIIFVSAISHMEMEPLLYAGTDYNRLCPSYTSWFLSYMCFTWRFFSNACLYEYVTPALASLPAPPFTDIPPPSSSSTLRCTCQVGGSSEQRRSAGLGINNSVQSIFHGHLFHSRHCVLQFPYPLPYPRFYLGRDLRHGALQ